MYGFTDFCEHLPLFISQWFCVTRCTGNATHWTSSLGHSSGILIGLSRGLGLLLPIHPHFIENATMPLPLNRPGLPSSPAQHIKRSRSLANPAKQSQPTLEKQWPISPPPLTTRPKKTTTLSPFPRNPNKPTRYSVTLQDRSSQAAITLNIYNTKEAAVYPMYVEGEKISGSVELTIGRSMEIKEVLVSVSNAFFLFSRNLNFDSRMYGV